MILFMVKYSRVVLLFRWLEMSIRSRWLEPSYLSLFFGNLCPHTPLSRDLQKLNPRSTTSRQQGGVEIHHAVKYSRGGRSSSFFFVWLRCLNLLFANTCSWSVPCCSNCSRSWPDCGIRRSSARTFFHSASCLTLGNPLLFSNLRNEGVEFPSRPSGFRCGSILPSNMKDVGVTHPCFRVESEPPHDEVEEVLNRRLEEDLQYVRCRPSTTTSRNGCATNRRTP